MLKQFLPSEYCLKCDVCCRFLDKNSPYAPFFLRDEIKTPQAGRISLIRRGDSFACPYFLTESNKCRIYDTMPLDCGLYPFIICYDRDCRNINLCADTKCPYINEAPGLSVSHPYIKYLSEVLNSDDMAQKICRDFSFVMPYQADAVVVSRLEKLSEGICKTSFGFKKLALEHRGIFDGYMSAQAESGFSMRAFANIYIWSDLFNILWKVIDKNLCVFYKYGNEFSMMFPPLSKEAVLESIDILRRLNGPGKSLRIENIAPGEIRQLENAGVKIHKNTDEYIYLAEDLKALKGNKFGSQRAAVNQFSKKYKHTYRPFDIEDADECLDLYMEWAGERKTRCSDGVYRRLLEDNFSAHKKAMLNYEELGFTGRVVELGGRIRAYTFAFRLDSRTYCVALEVADLGIKGLPQFIYKRLCEDLRGAKYINAMDDSGLENLRQVKLSYNPCKILTNYIGVAG